MRSPSSPPDLDGVHANLVRLTQRPLAPISTVSNVTTYSHHTRRASGKTGTHTPTFQQNMPSGHSLPPGAHMPSPAERVSQLRGIQGGHAGLLGVGRRTRDELLEPVRQPYGARAGRRGRDEDQKLRCRLHTISRRGQS